MKNPSKDKAPPIAQNSINRLTKTQVQPKQSQTLENTYYGQGKIMHEPKITNQLPPRAGSSQKINYKVEENMTSSKIQEAKKGLQLLKKKMSRNGMSREKNNSVEKTQEYQPDPPVRKTMYRPPQNQQEEYSQPQPKRTLQKVSDRQPPREEVKKTPPISSKNFAAERSPPIPTKNQVVDERPIRRAPKSQFINEAEEAPLKGNQDFMAILEQAMAKEAASKGGAINRDVKPTKKMQNFQEEQAQIQLAECSKGCGRQFNVQTIAKHEKVCEKVFQSKRKAFNAAAQRQIQGQDFKQPPPPQTSKIQSTIPKKTPPPAKQSKVPKWKLESAAFRAGIKAGRGQALTAEQKAVQQQASNMTQCNYCGRKFNADAAKRHIPICEAKAKQVPMKNVKKK